MQSLFVGIDVSSRSNVVCLMLPDGTRHSVFNVGNTFDGARELSGKIVKVCGQHELSSVVIGLEATGVYGDNLLCFLREDAALAALSPKLHLLNPKQISKFKDAYPELSKTDAIDAFIIADRLRFGRIPPSVYTVDYRYHALRMLTRARCAAVENLSRQKQQFMNYVFLKCSALAQDKVFSNTFGATSLAVLEAFESPDELVNMDLDQLIDFLVEKGKNRFPDPSAVAQAVQAAARGSYRLPKTVNDSVNQVLSISISSMRAVQAQIKALDIEIERQLALIPNTLLSVKGIGPVFTAGIIAEVGDVRRFPNQAALAKYAGLAWKTHQSGQFEADTTRLIQSGNRFLRAYLCEAAFALVRCDTEFRRFYDLKYREVNRHQHKRALALTARKLVRLVFRLLTDNRLYIPAAG